jgi:CBS domain-containing protein
MFARNVMKAPVLTVRVSDLISDVAKFLLEKKISAAPVLDAKGKLVGMVSEGDLMRRFETSTERKHSWWSLLLSDDYKLMREYIKSHGRTIGEIMSRNVITASPSASLREVADLMERHSIKRIPIVENNSLVGIVSRVDLLRAFTGLHHLIGISVDDAKLRDKILAQIEQQPWKHSKLINILVQDGVVDLSGIVDSDTERQAIRVAAESVAGVKAVNDHMINRPTGAEI